MEFDVLIVGGGPAGLSAALILGRCHRKVLLCDEGRQRNLSSQAIQPPWAGREVSFGFPGRRAGRTLPLQIRLGARDAGRQASFLPARNSSLSARTARGHSLESPSLRRVLLTNFPSSKA